MTSKTLGRAAVAPRRAGAASPVSVAELSKDTAATPVHQRKRSPVVSSPASVALGCGDDIALIIDAALAADCLSSGAVRLAASSPRRAKSLRGGDGDGDSDSDGSCFSLPCWGADSWEAPPLAEAATSDSDSSAPSPPGWSSPLDDWGAVSSSLMEHEATRCAGRATKRRRTTKRGAAVGLFTVGPKVGAHPLTKPVPSSSLLRTAERLGGARLAGRKRKSDDQLCSAPVLRPLATPAGWGPPPLEL